MELTGYGDGDGDGSGSGYGYGYGEITVPESCPWPAYHYIAERNSALRLRNGKETKVGEHLHEDSIELCQRGLHASLRQSDAEQWAPNNAALTKVLVWGRVIVSGDKLVATDRKIVEVVQ